MPKDAFQTKTFWKDGLGELVTENYSLMINQINCCMDSVEDGYENGEACKKQAEVIFSITVPDVPNVSF